MPLPFVDERRYRTVGCGRRVDIREKKTRVRKCRGGEPYRSRTYVGMPGRSIIHRVRRGYGKVEAASASLNLELLRISLRANQQSSPDETFQKPQAQARSPDGPQGADKPEAHFVP
ncbi:glycerophosphocholine phosphodiesterase [Pseudozyma hubeiensis SY62]|uniref:Glycerophosphocholine phosphodiesterase n=1 Tax=Pseudozyma hubeiensis (strain SY62) TaxID=1305764 RepID=R9P5W8_PSEHS|nr:glycerophosphocholine phosphodiesterase [Pseudozyma hubeiensis SY62]GAC96724.1 glycerophosphocholine phosphodiesterase [Pseudozyma hubeiensis SY62]